MNIPDKEHYAVVYQDSVYIPGDERSQSHPGHGYPAETKHYQVYLPFDTLAEVETWVNRYGKSKTCKVLKCQPMKVVIETKIVMS